MFERSFILSVAGIFLLFIGSGSILAQQQPETYSLERYSVIWQKSMFRKPDGALRSTDSVYWSLAGIFSYGTEKGAVLVNRSTGAIEQVDMSGANQSGLKLIEVETDAKGIPSRVKIAQNGETFWVSSQKLSKRSPNSVNNRTTSLFSSQSAKSSRGNR